MSMVGRAIESFRRYRRYCRFVRQERDYSLYRMERVRRVKEEYWQKHPGQSLGVAELCKLLDADRERIINGIPLNPEVPAGALSSATESRHDAERGLSLPSQQPPE